LSTLFENSPLLRNSEEFMLKDDGTDMDAGAEYNPEVSNARP
jgi:hypothetical protein